MTAPQDETPRREPPVQAPQTQEEVIASVLSDLGRRWGIVREAAGRAMREEGPASDAARAVAGTVRGMIHAVRDAVPGTPPPGRPETREPPRRD